MTVTRAIERWRRRHESLFSSKVRVQRTTAPGTFNQTTGAIGDPTVTTVYEGSALIRSFAWQGTDVRTGEQESRMRGSRGAFPHDTPVKKDDVVTVLASVHDAGLVGRIFRITDVLPDDWQVVRQAILEEVT